MKRWKNHIASSLLLVAFLISLYAWNRSSRWFEKWNFSFGIAHADVLSKDSKFVLGGRTYPMPSASFEWKSRKDFELRNRRGSMKFGGELPTFTTDSGLSSSGHPPARWRKFQLTGNFWQLSLLLLVLTTGLFLIERKISQRRLEN